MTSPDQPDQPDRRLNARYAAHLSWARTSDRTARTAPAREALLRRFEDEVDPSHELPAAERAQRAQSARRAYFTRLALNSARSRRAAALPGQPTTRGEDR